jgi:hypothetical protein
MDSQTEDKGEQHEREHHLDEREPLAYAYDGVVLVAVGYRTEIVEHWEEATSYTVVRTPEGEER